MSEFNFETGMDQSAADFNFTGDTVDPEIMEKFFDPGFSFTQEFTAPAHNSDPFAGSFTQIDSPITATTSPILNAQPVVQSATAAAPVTRLTDSAAVRPVGETGVRPVTESSARNSDVAQNRMQRKEATAGPVATPAHSVQNGTGDVIRPAVRAPDSQRPAHVPPVRQAVGQQAVRVLTGSELRKSAEQLMEKLYSQRQVRERTIESLTKDKELLIARLNEFQSRFESVDCEKQRLMSQLKEKDVALESQGKEAEVLRIRQNNLLSRMSQVAKDCAKFSDMKLLFQKINQSKDQTLQQLKQKCVDTISGLTEDLTQMKKTTDMLESKLSDATELLKQRQREIDRIKEEQNQSLAQLRMQQNEELRAVQSAAAAKEESLLADNFELQQQVLGLTEELASVRAETESLEEQIDELKCCESELVTLQTEFQQLNTQKQEVEEKCQRLEDELSESQSNYVSLTDDLRQLQEEYDQMRLNYEDRLYSGKQELAAEVKKREEQNQLLQSEMQRMDTRILSLEGERVAAVTRAEALQSENQIADRKKAELVHQLIDLTDQLNTSKGQFNTSLEAAEQEKLVAEQKMAALTDEVASLNKEREAIVKERDAVSREFAECKKRVEEDGMKLSEVQAKLAEAEQELESQVMQNKKQEAVIQQQRAMNDKSEIGTNRRLQEKDNQIARQAEQIDELKKTVEQLRRKGERGKRMVTPSLSHSPPKQKTGRRALELDDEETDVEDAIDENEPQRLKKSLPAKKQPVKSVKKPVERKKSAKKTGKKQEDVYLEFADASAGDAPPRRKLPTPGSSANQSQNGVDQNGDQSRDSNFEWF